MDKIISEEVFAEVLDRLLDEWPDTIDVSEKTHFSSGGTRIPKLAEAYDRIERDVVNKGFDNPEVASLAESINFSLYTALHLLSRKSERICLRDVPLANIRSRFESQTIYSITPR